MAAGREAFLYMDPKPPYGSFAQCSTCIMWTGKTCTILGPNFPVDGDDSCCLYVHGEPSRDQLGKERMRVSPQEAGFVRRPVRCENCTAYNSFSSRCALFEDLNEKMPQMFRLDPNVHPKGCCNAQQPKGLMGGNRG